MEPVAAVHQLDEQQRSGVRPPVGWLDDAFESESKQVEVSAPRIPDRGPALAFAFVADGDAPIAGDGRPGEAGDLEALVAQIPDDRPGARVDHAH
jgi:hypothetical protein